MKKGGSGDSLKEEEEAMFCQSRSEHRVYGSAWILGTLVIVGIADLCKQMNTRKSNQPSIKGTDVLGRCACV